jgi:hypothetical protein
VSHIIYPLDPGGKGGKVSEGREGE